MFNPLKLKIRIKIIIAIMLALLISLLFIKPKESNIPTMPVALLLDLTQQSDNTLEMKSIEIVNRYSPDYQTNLTDNYYLIQLKKNKEVLFTGKMPKQDIFITESLSTEGNNQIEVKSLENFQLYLPYFTEATTIIITEDSGKESLRVDLTSSGLSMPKIRNTCGDGICTDNENLLMCYSDCKYLLPKWLPK